MRPTAIRTWAHNTLFQQVPASYGARSGWSAPRPVALWVEKPRNTEKHTRARPPSAAATISSTSTRRCWPAFNWPHARPMSPYWSRLVATAMTVTMVTAATRSTRKINTALTYPSQPTETDGRSASDLATRALTAATGPCNPGVPREAREAADPTPLRLAGPAGDASATGRE